MPVYSISELRYAMSGFSSTVTGVSSDLGSEGAQSCEVNNLYHRKVPYFMLKEKKRKVYAVRQHNGSLCTQKQPGVLHADCSRKNCGLNAARLGPAVSNLQLRCFSHCYHLTTRPGPNTVGSHCVVH